MEMQYKKNLRRYLREDKVYQRYLKHEYTRLNDYDKFCVEHCDDIYRALHYIDKYEKQIGKLYDYLFEHDDDEFVSKEEINKIFEE